MLIAIGMITGVVGGVLGAVGGLLILNHLDEIMDRLTPGREARLAARDEALRRWVESLVAGLDLSKVKVGKISAENLTASGSTVARGDH